MVRPLPRDELLDRHQRCMTILAEAKEFLDYIMLPDTLIEEKLNQTSEQETPEGMLMGLLAVFVDKVHQSCPSEDQFKYFIHRMGELAMSGQLFVVIQEAVNKVK